MISDEGTVVTARSIAIAISRTSNATESTRLSLAAFDTMLENKSNILRRHSMEMAMLRDSIEEEANKTSCWGEEVGVEVFETLVVLVSLSNH